MLLMWLSAKKTGKKWHDASPIEKALKKLATLVKKERTIDNERDWDEFAEYYSDGEDLKKEALDAIELALEDLDCREVAFVDFGNRIYAMTGGMSWGDSPTDTFAHFDVVMRMPMRLLKKAGLE